MNGGKQDDDWHEEDASALSLIGSYKKIASDSDDGGVDGVVAVPSIRYSSSIASNNFCEFDDFVSELKFHDLYVDAIEYRTDRRTNSLATETTRSWSFKEGGGDDDLTSTISRMDCILQAIKGQHEELRKREMLLAEAEKCGKTEERKEKPANKNRPQRQSIDDSSLIVMDNKRLRSANKELREEITKLRERLRRSEKDVAQKATLIKQYKDKMQGQANLATANNRRNEKSMRKDAQIPGMNNSGIHLELLACLAGENLGTKGVKSAADQQLLLINVIKSIINASTNNDDRYLLPLMRLFLTNLMKSSLKNEPIKISTVSLLKNFGDFVFARVVSVEEKICISEYGAIRLLISCMIVLRTVTQPDTVAVCLKTVLKLLSASPDHRLSFVDLGGIDLLISRGNFLKTQTILIVDVTNLLMSCSENSSNSISNAVSNHFYVLAECFDEALRRGGSPALAEKMLILFVKLSEIYRNKKLFNAYGLINIIEQNVLRNSAASDYARMHARTIIDNLSPSPCC